MWEVIREAERAEVTNRSIRRGIDIDLSVCVGVGMAFYVKITKTFEDLVSATYRFEDSAHCAGTLKFSKPDGQAVLLTPMSGDEHGYHFDRAAAKLRKHWKRGELPDFTEWAS